MFGPCKVCMEKDKRTQTLQSEVDFLRKLVRPNVSNSITAVELEADGVMSGQTEQIVIQTHEEYDREEQARILAERDDLLNGTY